MRAFAVFGLLLLAAPAVAQEKFVSSDASVRTILDFKAPAAAVQKLLPGGWELDSPSSGSATGSNLRITFSEGVWGEDAQGKPTPTGRTITVGFLAKKKGAEVGGLMLVNGLTAGAAPGAYGVYAKASTTSQRTLRTGADGATTVEEVWDAKAENGDAVQLQLQYVRAPAVRGKVDLRVYSGAKPEFYRIYRYTLATDALRGVGTAGDRVRAFTFKASGPKLAPLFDGSEQLVAITSVPYYSRQVFLPGS